MEKNTELKLRGLEPADEEIWMQLWRGYQNYYEVDLSSTEADTWARLIEPGIDGPFCIVCEDESGCMVGFTTYLFHGHTWQPEPRCYLVDLYSRPDIRGKGVGRALIMAVYERADAHDCSQVYWLTQDFNKAGRVLYDKVAKVTPFIKYQR